MTHLVSPEAESDLLDIWSYIATESNAQTADRLIDSVIERFLLLARHPFAGTLRHDLRTGLRTFPVHSYLIFYRIDADDVLILRVLHGHRDLETVLRA